MWLTACQQKQHREPITVRIDVHLQGVVRRYGEFIASSTDDLLRLALGITLAGDAAAGSKTVSRNWNSGGPRSSTAEWLGGVCIVPRLCTRNGDFSARTSRLQNASTASVSHTMHNAVSL